MRKIISGILFLGVVTCVFALFSCNKTKTVKPQQKAITEAVYASGFIVPENAYKVYALSEGYIVAKLKEAGDEVKKGEAIFQIQNDAGMARYGAASSALELARLNAGENSPVLADLKNKLKSAEAKYRTDSLNLTRYKNMLAAAAITQTQYDQAALAAEVSLNDLRSAREQLQKMREQLQVELKNAQSTATSSAQDLGNYYLRSMMDGMIYDITKELGEAVRRNDIVATIGEKNNKVIELSVDQQDINKVKPGQKVIVKMDVTGSQTYEAVITKVYPSMNQSDQSFKVKATFAKDYGLNFVNTSVEANIIIAQKDRALIIPRSALRGEDEVALKGIAGEKVVKIKKGLENLEFVEVLEGISLSDELVLPADK